MKLTINQLSIDLKTKFAGKIYPKPDCYNGHPGNGYSIVGHAGITKAIIQSGLPVYNFWSGKNPTPSSQAPSEIVDYARKIALYRMD